MTNNDQRPGERALPFDPSKMADDDRVIFIGKIRSPWKSRNECPKNMVAARKLGQAATVEIDEVFRAGLKGLHKFTHAIVLYWMNEARRDLIVQKPHHKPEPVGVFALRSPVRPNPIAIATVRILEVDQVTGQITIDAIDCVDGTPLVDVKPWIGSLDEISTA